MIVGQDATIDIGRGQATNIFGVHPVVDAFSQPIITHGHAGLQVDNAQIRVESRPKYRQGRAASESGRLPLRPVSHNPWHPGHMFHKAPDHWGAAASDRFLGRASHRRLKRESASRGGLADCAPSLVCAWRVQVLPLFLPIRYLGSSNIAPDSCDYGPKNDGGQTPAPFSLHKMILDQTRAKRKTIL